ncbi:SDR family oxidoreductase [Mesorhizobium sp. B2-4-14]|uniref:SDR family oxidoreductase n=1 Tax=Mesorhizobium sp. B2-4-14 TaxID=2589935 RepID=UPI00112CC59F|nr:SDR family oxidoreductase [Mesorhizobium sp. B2-4-14]TPL10217.1 SDR family oxidoreductase [Mesorhizobium sp. B2-4-14]
MTTTVFITGASRGVGRACATAFLDAGWNVFATARDPDQIGISPSQRLATAKLDLRDDSSISAAVEHAIGRFGSIDILLNNAGIGLGGPVEAVSREEFHGLLDVNVVGAALVTKALLPTMRLKGSGLIINVGSLAGAVGLPYLAPYCASKFALAGLSEAMRYELGPFGIRVKLVELTGSRTQFKQPILHHEAYATKAAAIERRLQEGLALATPPDTVAKEILRIAGSSSDRLRYVVGTGGLLARIRGFLPDRMISSMLARAFGLI